MIKAASVMPLVTGNSVNPEHHVWGYLKNNAVGIENQRFESILQKLVFRETIIQTVKNLLLKLAVKYQEDNLLNGYFFYK